MCSQSPLHKIVNGSQPLTPEERASITEFAMTQGKGGDAQCPTMMTTGGSAAPKQFDPLRTAAKTPTYLSDMVHEAIIGELPPTEICEAAELINNWMIEHGRDGDWELGPVASRKLLTKLREELDRAEATGAQ